MLANNNLGALSRHYIILVFFHFFLIYMVLGSGKSSFFNAYFISNLEIIFIVSYTLLNLTKISQLSSYIKEHRSTLIILMLWVFSVLYSYFSSPLYTEQNTYMSSRLLQTFTHVALFFTIWHYLKNTEIKLSYLFYTIVFSTVLVAIYFYYYWINSMGFGFGETLNDPPLNSHVRHTGYQVGAALSFFFIFLIRNCIKQDITFTHILASIFLWGFLFWLGGRGAILSAFVSFLCIVFILKYRNIKFSNIVKITMLSILAGMLLSELLVVYPWNGIIDSYQRSISAESITQLSTGRITIWIAALESLKGNFIFGLGPQGFYLMENTIKGLVQPHNVFIQFLVEWGIVGTSLFLLLLIKATWAGIKLHILNKDNYISPTALAAGAVICTLSVNALTDGTYYHPQPSVYLAIAFAIWVLPAMDADVHQKKSE